MLVSSVQSQKLAYPMVLRLLGSVAFVIPVHPIKAAPQRLVTPSPITTVLILSLYDSQGLSAISPVPVMVRTPASSSFQVMLSPQLPLWTVFVANALAGSRENTISSASMRLNVFFFISFLLSCLVFPVLWLIS